VQNSIVPERIPCRVACRATDVHQSASYKVQLQRMCCTLVLLVFVQCRTPCRATSISTAGLRAVQRSTNDAGLRAVRPWCWGSSRGLAVIADINQTICQVLCYKKNVYTCNKKLGKNKKVYRKSTVHAAHAVSFV